MSTKMGRNADGRRQAGTRKDAKQARKEGRTSPELLERRKTGRKDEGRNQGIKEGGRPDDNEVRKREAEVVPWGEIEGMRQ